MPNEICANCGRTINYHLRGCGVPRCYNDRQEDVRGFLFKPSGRVAVPVAFIEAVRKAVDGMDHGGCWCDMAIGNPMVKEHTNECKAMAGVRTMLDQIKGGEK